MPLPRGTALGPYEILEPLGAGGMGEVYRARDTRLGRDVAIKVISDALAAEGRARFEREVKAASGLTHPNICAVHDVGEADGRLFFVMELVDGVTLGAHAGRRSLEPSAVIAIGTQIADALDAAHASGIVHRDIKPGNILITRRGHIKVAGFGVAARAAVPDGETIDQRGVRARDECPARAKRSGTRPARARDRARPAFQRSAPIPRDQLRDPHHQWRHHRHEHAVPGRTEAETSGNGGSRFRQPPISANGGLPAARAP